MTKCVVVVPEIEQYYNHYTHCYKRIFSILVAVVFKLCYPWLNVYDDNDAHHGDYTQAESVLVAAEATVVA